MIVSAPAVPYVANIGNATIFADHLSAQTWGTPSLLLDLNTEQKSIDMTQIDY